MIMLKKLTSAVFACLMTFSLVSATAFAGEIYTFTEEEIDSAPVKPAITIDSKLLSTEELKECDNQVEISVNVSGADMKYASTGLHIYYDSRLTIAENNFGYPDIKQGDAIKYLSPTIPIKDPSASEYGMNGIFLVTSGNKCYGRDGTMWTITFILPDDVLEGDVFPIDIVYKENFETADMFSNVTNNRNGQLMSAYTFTKGIFNGTENLFVASAQDIAKCPCLADISPEVDGYIAVESIPETKTVCGDANEDGFVNMADVTTIIQHIGNKSVYGLVTQGLKNADINSDDMVTGEDAVIIQEFLAGIHESLPIRTS